MATWQKSGFHEMNQKKKSGAFPEKSGWLLPYIFSSSCHRKSQVAPSKLLFMVQIKGTIEETLCLKLANKTLYHLKENQNNWIGRQENSNLSWHSFTCLLCSVHLLFYLKGLSQENPDNNIIHQPQIMWSMWPILHWFFVLLFYNSAQK